MFSNRSIFSNQNNDNNNEVIGLDDLNEDTASVNTESTDAESTDEEETEDYSEYDVEDEDNFEIDPLTQIVLNYSFSAPLVLDCDNTSTLYDLMKANAQVLGLPTAGDVFDRLKVTSGGRYLSTSSYIPNPGESFNISLQHEAKG